MSSQRLAPGSLVVVVMLVVSVGLLGLAFVFWSPTHSPRAAVTVALLDRLEVDEAEVGEPRVVQRIEVGIGPGQWRVISGDDELSVEDGVLHVRNEASAPTVLEVPVERIDTALVTHLRVPVLVRNGEGMPRVQLDLEDESGPRTVTLKPALAFGVWSDAPLSLADLQGWRGDLVGLRIIPSHHPRIAASLRAVELLDLGHAPRRSRFREGRLGRDALVGRPPFRLVARDVDPGSLGGRLVVGLASIHGPGFDVTVTARSGDGETELFATRVGGAGAPLAEAQATIASELGLVDLVFSARPLPGSSPGEVALIEPRFVREGRPPRRPSIILISLDTLRADYLGLNGHDRPTSPFLDRLARGAAVFDNALSQAPETLASHMTLMTGRYPSNHRVFKPAHRLADPAALLAHHLRQGGYRTAAFVEGGMVESVYGFDLGFDEYHDGTAPPSRPGGDAARTFELAREWLGGHDHHPFFLFVHTYETHTPYAAPEEFQARFVDPAYRGWLRGRLLDDDLARDLVDTEKRLPLTEEDRRYVIALYEAEIAYVDSVLEGFFRSLEETGRLDDTLVVILSDHGEDFGEAGGVAVHGHSLHGALTHVPLIVCGWLIPREQPVPARRIPFRVGLVDVAPTLLDIAGCDAVRGMQGQSLVPLLLGEVQDQGDWLDRAILSEDLTGFIRTAWLQGKDKYTHTLGIEKHRWEYLRKERPGLLDFFSLYEEDELHDLFDDPQERHNLAAGAPTRILALRDTVATWRRWIDSLPRPRRGAASVDSGSLQRLRSLGYIEEAEEAEEAEDPPSELDIIDKAEMERLRKDS